MSSLKSARLLVEGVATRDLRSDRNSSVKWSISEVGLIGKCWKGKEFHVLLKELLFFVQLALDLEMSFFQRSTGVPQADMIRLHLGDLT